MAGEWDLLAGVLVQFSSTLLGVYLAFVVSERAERRRRLRDSLYAPFAELMDSYLDHLKAWKPLPIADLDALVRSATASGLTTPELREDVRRAEDAFELYNEHCTHFGLEVEHILTEDLGPLAQAKYALDSIVTVRKGDLITAKDFLFDPASYEVANPDAYWFSAYVAVALASKKALSPGHRLEAGSAPPANAAVIVWRDQKYVMEPTFENIARRTFAKIRDHTIRVTFEDNRRRSREEVQRLLAMIRKSSGASVAPTPGTGAATARADQ